MTVTPSLIMDLPTWSGINVSVADVIQAVDDLRRSEQRAATRTSVANLVIVAGTADEVDDAATVIDHLGVRHPARIITLLASDANRENPDRIDADITMHAGEAAGHAIWSDEIRLRIGGKAVARLDSVLRPLLLADLPTFVWFGRGLPPIDHVLVRLADAVVIDTKSAVDYTEGEMAMHRAFRHVTELVGLNQATVIDLSWDRVRPWRRLLASQFYGDIFRPFVHGVHRVEITGKLGPRTLLAGWLASSLKLDRTDLHLYDGRHVAMKLFAEYQGKQGEFSVERVVGERLVRASAMIENGPGHAELLGLPDDALPQALSSALKQFDRDWAYEQAISVVSAWD